MKKTLLIAIMATLTWAAQAQDSLRVTIFGDSYSTFEGWLTPDTN